MATLPFLYDMADKTHWFTSAQLADMIAVSESTPGPIGVNMATYVGFTTAGFWGGLIATLALVTPSIIVIMIISYFLKSFRENKYVDAAFYGLRPASTGLIAAAGMTVVSITLLQMDLFKDSGNILNLFNIKKDPTLRTLLEVLIPKLGENLGLDKDFSYKDLFYCIYEKKLEENNINRIQLYDFHKLYDVVNKNINENKSGDDILQHQVCFQGLHLDLQQIDFG